MAFFSRFFFFAFFSDILKKGVLLFGVFFGFFLSIFLTFSKKVFFASRFFFSFFFAFFHFSKGVFLAFFLVFFSKKAFFKKTAFLTTIASRGSIKKKSLLGEGRGDRDFYFLKYGEGGGGEGSGGFPCFQNERSHESAPHVNPDFSPPPPHTHTPNHISQNLKLSLQRYGSKLVFQPFSH